MRSSLAFPPDCCARSDPSSFHQADRPLRPTHYFIAHTALVRQLVFISTPPPRLANRAAHDLDGSPTGIISVGYDGSTLLSDLREPGGAPSTLTHERSASPSRSPRPLPCSFSDDLDVLQLRSTRSPSRRTRAWRTRPTPTTVSRPSDSSRACRATRAESRSTAGPSGCVLLSLSLSSLPSRAREPHADLRLEPISRSQSIAASPHHATTLSASLDGSAMLASGVRALRKRRLRGHYLTRLYRLEVERTSGAVRMWDNLDVEVRRAGSRSLSLSPYTLAGQQADPKNGVHCSFVSRSTRTTRSRKRRRRRSRSSVRRPPGRPSRPSRRRRGILRLRLRRCVRRGRRSGSGGSTGPRGDRRRAREGSSDGRGRRLF